MATAGYLQLEEGDAPETPTTNFHRVYVKSDGQLYLLDDLGTETAFLGAGAVSADDITSGTLAVARLPVGTLRLPAALDATLRVVQDRDGTASPLQLATAAAHLTSSLTQASGDDLFPNGAGHGLAQRLVDPLGLSYASHHFRTGDAPLTDGDWAWVSSAGWKGAPTVVTWAHEGDYLRIYENASALPIFLALENPAGLSTQAGDFVLCGMPGQSGLELGCRLDDGTDANYFEVRIVSPSTVTGGVYLASRYRLGGGAVTEVATDDLPLAMYVVGLKVYGSGYVYPYIYGPLGVSLNPLYSSFSFTIKRIGIIYRPASIAGRYGYVDWVFSNFAQ